MSSCDWSHSDNASWLGVGFHLNRCEEQRAEKYLSKVEKESELGIEILLLWPGALNNVESELQSDGNYFFWSQELMSLASSESREVMVAVGKRKVRTVRRTACGV